MMPNGSDRVSAQITEYESPSVLLALGRFIRGKEPLILAVCFLLFFMPYESAVPRLFYLAWKGSVSLISVGAVVLLLVSKKATLRWACLSLFFLFYFLGSSILASASFPLVLNSFYALYGIGFITVFELGLQHDYRQCLRSFLVGAFIMCAAHYVVFLISPEGVLGFFGGGISLYAENGKEYWYLLTYDNATIYYYLPPLMVGLHYALLYWEKGLLPVLVCELLSLAMFVNNASLVALATMALVLLATILVYVVHKFAQKGSRGAHARSKSMCRASARKRYLAVNLLGILGSLAFAWLVVSGMLGVVSSSLGKGSSLSGRTGIWRRTFEWISDSPLFGVGREYAEFTIEKIGQNHVHHIVLQFLFVGGIIALVLFVVAVYLYAPPKSKAVARGFAPLPIGILLFYFSASFDWVPSNPIPFALFVVSYHYIASRLPTSTVDAPGR